jgi:nucleotide-binding universal stress UspA family protein
MQILVGTDFSETSLFALDHAVDLAARLGASVLVVHALEVPLYAYPDAGMRRLADVDVPFLRAAEESLAAAVAARRSRGVPLEGIVRKGAPWKVIEAVAEERDAAYVVVGTHGRSALPRMLLGSVAERVVRTCNRPVLVVHGPALHGKEGAD